MTKRRAKGDGSVYQRKDRRYIGEYTDANGKRRYVSGKSKADVRSKLRKLLAEREEGIAYYSGNLTVGAYLDKFIEAEKDNVGHRQWKRQEQNVRLHIKPVLGNVKLPKLNVLQLQSLYRAKLDSGLSHESVRKIHVCLSKALSRAVRFQLVPRNVAKAVTPPRVPRREVHTLTAEQLKRLLEVAKEKQPNLYAAYVLACTTGMRQAEIFALQKDSVDLHAGTIRIKQTIFHGKLQLPKTPHSSRSIRLSQLAIRSLWEHFATRPVDSDFVFCNTKGNPVDIYQFIYRCWYPLKAAAQLPEQTRFHDLRSSAATMMIANGVNLKVVSEMLGHADVAFTARVYQGILSSMQEQAANCMDDVLG
jgi:integrase